MKKVNLTNRKYISVLVNRQLADYIEFSNGTASRVARELMQDGLRYRGITPDIFIHGLAKDHK